MEEEGKHSGRDFANHIGGKRVVRETLASSEEIYGKTVYQKTGCSEPLRLWGGGGRGIDAATKKSVG